MMSAPVAATSSGNMAFTVAPVPTGMKAGVRMTPRGVAMAPVRASPSRALRVKEKRSVISLSPLPSSHRGEGVFSAGFGRLRRAEQAGIAIGIEAIALRDRMGIGAPHEIQAGEGCDQHEQG